MHCRFVPPYLLERLAPREDTSDAGAITLRLDAHLRALRERPATRRAGIVAETGDRRLIHDAGGQEQLPGTVARRETDPPTGDAAVDEAFESSGHVWDLFEQVFGRSSYDGAGSTVSVTVHYGTDYDNAFWDGTQLVFGDGDGEIFDRFTKPMDVLAHEFSHGVVQFTTAFAYQGQSGALNESVADVFASMTKQRFLGQSSEQADWLIGEGIFLPGVAAKALRSMTEPGTAYDDERLGRDPQVGSMADYVETTDDNGGVHINSGIPNRAFALAAIALGGNSFDRAGRVWYDALTAREVGADADFAAFAQATISSAGRIFADAPEVAQQVQQAWATVGVMTPSGAALDESAAASTAEPADPDPTEDAPAIVAVRRTGGVAGAVRQAELPLDQRPEGPEVRSLLSRIDFRQVTASAPTPDRFRYTLTYGHVEVTLGEDDLTPDLSEVVHLVLRSGRTDH